jgi:hypothetical protein
MSTQNTRPRSSRAKRKLPPGYHLNHALLLAGRDGRWLSEQTETHYTTVSRWRKGMVPSEEKQDAILAAFATVGETLTREELGW